jgi:hypothetical protein
LDNSKDNYKDKIHNISYEHANQFENLMNN